MRRCWLWPLLASVWACTELDLPAKEAFVGTAGVDVKEDAAGQGDSAADTASGADTAAAADATTEIADDAATDTVQDAATDAGGDGSANPDADAQVEVDDGADPVDSPDTVDTPDTVGTPDTPDTADTADKPDAPDSAEVVDKPDTSDTPDAVDAAEVTDKPDTVDAIDPADAGDAAPDTAGDSAADAVPDAEADAGEDAGIDGSADGSTDAGGDSASDAAVDAAIDAGLDAVDSVDTADTVDATADGATDAVADAAADGAEAGGADGANDAAQEVSADGAGDASPDVEGCKFAVDCPASATPCQAPICSGGTCGFAALADGVTCTDGNACTASETCAGGACGGGKAVSCDDGLSCTADSCSPSKGCVSTPTTAPCDDGNACTVGDVCAAVAGSGAQCQAGKPLDAAVDCDDKTACTSDSCEPTKGCVHAAVAGPCMDGGCKVDTACQAGQCQSGKTEFLFQPAVLAKHRVSGVTGMLAGGVAVASFDQSTASTSSYVTGYGPTGTKIWSWAQGTSSYAYGVTTAPDGKIVAAVLQDMGVLGGGSPSFVYSASLVLLNPVTGSQVTKAVFKTLDGNVETNGTFQSPVAVSADGSKAVMGATANVKAGIAMTDLAAAAFDLRLYALQLSNNSAAVLAKVGGNDMDFLDSVAARPDGGYCVVGRTRSTDWLTIDTPSNSKTEIDGLIVGIASNGALEWSVRTGKAGGQDYFGAVLGLADGGCLANGYLADNSSRLVRVDKAGKITQVQAMPGLGAMRALSSDQWVGLDYDGSLRRFATPQSGPAILLAVSPKYHTFIPSALGILPGGAAAIGGYIKDVSGGYLTVDGFGNSQCMSGCGKVGPLGCTDNNPCTLDVCLTSKGCASANLPDGSVCGTAKTCTNGVCQ